MIKNKSYSELLSAQNEILSNCSTNTTMKSTANQINTSLLAVPEVKLRKHSLPLINTNQLSPSKYLESNIPRKSTPSTLLDGFDFITHGKRLSQVGIAVGHHLSTTMGWKLLANHSDIVKQSKCLCARYIRFKLRKCGLVNKRMNLQRLKSMCNITLDATTGQVAIELRYLILELERSYPKLYSSVLKNISSQSLKSVNGVQSVIQLISQELFRNDITWARIAALYAIAGALAVDCVQIGRPEYIMPIIDSISSFIDRDIAGWLANQGGWDSLIYRFRTEDYWRLSLIHI